MSTPPASTQARQPMPTEYVGTVAFFVACALVLRHLWLGATAGAGLWIAGAALLGYVGADFISGLVHWGFDTWGKTTTPVLGKTFIGPFRLHHSDPKEMTYHGFIATNGHNCLVTAPVLFGSLAINPSTGPGAFLITLLFSLSFGTFLTNQFHKWAHEEDLGPVITFLQKTNLILSKPNHDVHHVRPYDSYYCITTGWLNPLLKGLKFYRGLEAVITAVTGARPRVDDLAQA